MSQATTPADCKPCSSRKAKPVQSHVSDDWPFPKWDAGFTKIIKKKRARKLAKLDGIGDAPY